MDKLGFRLPNGNLIRGVVLDCSLGIRGAGPPSFFAGDSMNIDIDRKNSTTILKSITAGPKEGNFGAPWYLPRGWAMTDYGFPLPKKLCYVNTENNSTVNSFGLSNDGFDDFMQIHNFYQKTIIPSIFLEFGKGSKDEIKKVLSSAIYMADKLRIGYTKNGFRIKAVVLNISCPNDENGVCVFEDEIVKVVKAFKDKLGHYIPIGIKYSYMQNISLAKTLDSEVYIAFHQAINTIPFKVVYGDKKFSWLSHIGHGGVSGPDITKMALEYGIKLREANLRGKLILGGGISTLDDAIERAKYADAIAIGILVNKDTNKANEIIKYFA
jgi:dihydroorotate dehydrogenase